ncbi:MAG TPA: hypothetical protein DCF61_00285 [Alphaproteobacteria bacterium]|nr:hypothetical protein [Alphaproteobacteria bacterium]
MAEHRPFPVHFHKFAVAGASVRIFFATRTLFMGVRKHGRKDDDKDFLGCRGIESFNNGAKQGASR